MGVDSHVPLSSVPKAYKIIHSLTLEKPQKLLCLLGSTGVYFEISAAAIALMLYAFLNCLCAAGCAPAHLDHKNMFRTGSIPKDESGYIWMLRPTDRSFLSSLPLILLFLHYENGDTLKQVIQKSRECSIPGSIQDQVGWSLGQPSLVEGVTAQSREGRTR